MAEYTEYRMGKALPALNIRLIGSLQGALLWACMSIITASLIYLVAQLGITNRMSEIISVLPESLTWIDFFAGDLLRHNALLYFAPNTWWLSCLCIAIPVNGVASITIRKI